MTVLEHPTPSLEKDSAASQGSWAYFRKVFTGTLTVVVTITAALCIILAMSTHETRSGEYETFGHPVLSMLSGSMTPVISTGDLVVDDALNAQQAQHLRVGQIISFRIAANSPVIITHRIVAIEHLASGVAYVTKGDANHTVDTPARPWSNVVGVVSYRIPDGGYVVEAVHRPAVMVIFLLIVLMALSVGPMIRWARRGRAEVEPSNDATR